MKLWDKGTDSNVDVMRYTAGDDNIVDLAFAKWDIVGSMAHTVMLGSVGLLSSSEVSTLLGGLSSLLEKERRGELIIEENVEDIHSQVESDLVAMLGSVGKKIHTGRSRNDQVLTDIRLYCNELIDTTAKAIEKVFTRLQALSNKYQDILLPGYTHMQPAMVSSFGLWFGSYAEALCDDLLMLIAARKMNSRNPLGSAAGYGSTLPLDRELTTRLLQFDNLSYNAAYAGLSRGKIEMSIASALASVAQTLNRFAMDACLFMGSEFHFISFPDEYVTGSSIMPQKKNPDVFELMRGKMNIVEMLPQQIANMVSNLMSGYNRDFQLLKKMVFGGFESVLESLNMLAIMLDNIKVRTDIMENSMYNSVFSTEEANRLAKAGTPFRDAYKIVARMVQEGKQFPATQLSEYSHKGSVGNLCNNEIKQLFDTRVSLFSSLSAYKVAESIIQFANNLQ